MAKKPTRRKRTKKLTEAELMWAIFSADHPNEAGVNDGQLFQSPPPKYKYHEPPRKEKL